MRGVVFDVGNVLFTWDPRFLYERLIDDDRALDAFLQEVVTHEWHFQHDAGRPFAETSAGLIAKHRHQGWAGPDAGGGLIVPLGIALTEHLGFRLMTEIDIIRDADGKGYAASFINSVTIGAT